MRWPSASLDEELATAVRTSCRCTARACSPRSPLQPHRPCSPSAPASWGAAPLGFPWASAPDGKFRRGRCGQGVGCLFGDKNLQHRGVRRAELGDTRCLRHVDVSRPSCSKPGHVPPPRGLCHPGNEACWVLNIASTQSRHLSEPGLCRGLLPVSTLFYRGQTCRLNGDMTGTQGLLGFQGWH